MSIIPEVGRRSLKFRLLIISMYVILAVMGVGMAYPFLMTVTASMSTAVDYYRFAPLSRSVWSREDRFVRGISGYFPESVRNSMNQFGHLFHGVKPEWTTWKAVGDDKPGSDAFAKWYLDQTRDPKRMKQIEQQAADYAEFNESYPISDTICTYDDRLLASFFRDRYMGIVRNSPGGKTLSNGEVEQKALGLLSDKWGIPFDSFFVIQANREKQTPMDQHAYWPIEDGRNSDFLMMSRAYRERRFIPGSMQGKWREFLDKKGISEINKSLGTHYSSASDVPYAPGEKTPKGLRNIWLEFIGSQVPVCEARPYPMKPLWIQTLGTTEMRKLIGLPDGGAITIEEFNKAFGTHYAGLQDIPYPVPASAPARMKAAYAIYIEKTHPLRLVDLKITPELSAKYREFAKKAFFGDLGVCNKTLSTNYKSWDDLILSRSMPKESDSVAGVWARFVDTLPGSVKIVHSAEDSYQRFLLAKYGSLDEVNKRYGWHLGAIEQAQMPFDMSYLVTFAKNERPLYLDSLTQNFKFVLYFMLLRGRAVMNTAILIALTLLAALTVNPLAAYALSRFQMRQTSTDYLFMLASMAFPAAVSMIPGYLLMRDLHLLNTYAALILPGVANGMSIFLLKGFFDSLPPELYEAAALDGAPEWMVFVRITLPLSKPILAVIALGSFFAAYGSWEWAVVVCQKPEMWTLAVWLYQFNTTPGALPWAVMASFVLSSIPVFLVFLLCQNIILRGIILPQMK